MAELLRGAPVAAAIRADLKGRAAALLSRGVTPKLALVRVGENPDDLYYEQSLRRGCEAIGAEAECLALDASCAQAELIAALEKLSEREDAHGCLLLRPLPAGMDSFAVFDALCAEKDLDGMTSHSLGALFSGRPGAFAPCTADAVMALLRHYGVDPAGKRAVIVGRSLVVGRPLAQLLLDADATVTVCHRQTADLAARCREAEILISAAGKPGLIGREHLRCGQVVIDVGTTAVGGTLRGDVDFAATEELSAAVTPVPGGVGSVTTALLLRHLIEAAERRA